MSSNKFWLVVLLTTTIILSACNFGTPAEPTEAPEAIYTRVAATVQANITLTAAAMPTATATIAPTNTPTPTNTLLPTVGTAVNTVAPGTTAIATLSPMPTQGGGTHSGDHAVFQYQQPADGTSVAAGEEFSIAWGLLNDGGTTWTTNYNWHYSSGTQVQSISYPVATAVAPNGRYEFFIAAIAPTTPGEYLTRWALYNAANQMVPGSEVYLRFVVAP